jgi:hypothetical protein
MGKLTIKNYRILNGTSLVNGWRVLESRETEAEYIMRFQHKEKNRIEEIKLSRMRTQSLFSDNDWVYWFYYDGEKTNQCVTIEYIKNINNMIDALSIVVERLWAD